MQSMTCHAPQVRIEGQSASIPVPVDKILPLRLQSLGIAVTFAPASALLRVVLSPLLQLSMLL
jgi:hypothetical protein